MTKTKEQTTVKQSTRDEIIRRWKHSLEIKREWERSVEERWAQERQTLVQASV